MMEKKPDFKNTFDISDYGPSKLQAAAPDLLAALEAIASLPDNSTAGQTIAKNAIGKVEGK